MLQVQKADVKPINSFTLTKQLLQNLNKFKIKPTSKLVLMYLVNCYNPAKDDVFPKQRTIADMLGISETSVVRAIAELHKEGLIISERKFSNRYKFTKKILARKMTAEKLQNEKLETVKMTASKHEQINEHDKSTDVNDFKILKDYAVTHNAKNVNAYINYLKKSGAAEKIINESKKAAAVKNQVEKDTQELLKKMRLDKENCSKEIPQCYKDLKEKLLKKRFFANAQNDKNPLYGVEAEF